MLFALLVLATDARADWLIAPFFGGVFGSQTTLIALGDGSGSSAPVFGVAGLWLSGGFLGVEGDLAFAPGFFDRNSSLLVGSHVRELTGGVVIAAPLSVTRESLRPYLTVGTGVIHAGIEDLAGLFTDTRAMPGLALGGGAIGFLTARTGIRFDLRHVRSLDRVTNPLTNTRESTLSYWRATVGVALRY